MDRHLNYFQSFAIVLTRFKVAGFETNWCQGMCGDRERENHDND